MKYEADVFGVSASLMLLKNMIPGEDAASYTQLPALRGLPSPKSAPFKH